MRGACSPRSCAPIPSSITLTTSLLCQNALCSGHHGFHVTGIEKRLDSDVEASLRARLPAGDIVLGDGARVLPDLAKAIGGEQGHRVAVIFDGEKRFGAFTTFEKLEEHVAFAVFDDTSVKPEGERFRGFLREHARAAWHSDDAAYHHHDETEDKELSRLPHLHAAVSEGAGAGHGKRGLAGLQKFEREMHIAEMTIGMLRPSSYDLIFPPLSLVLASAARLPLPGTPPPTSLCSHASHSASILSSVLTPFPPFNCSTQCLLANGGTSFAHRHSSKNHAPWSSLSGQHLC